MLNNTIRVCLLIVLALSSSMAWSRSGTPTDAEVKELQKKCEARRAEELAPIRAEKTQACIEQQLMKADHCERYYTTYGNATAGPGRSISQGYFYDLPECQSWIQAREALRVSRSRP